MISRPMATSVTLLIAAGCLVSCGAPKAAPATLNVSSVSAQQAKTVAEQLCADLRKMGDEDAVQRMAVRASEMKVSDADQDAIVDYAGAVTCPEQF